MPNSSTGERSPAVAASRSLRALSTAVIRPGVMLRWGFQSGAARFVVFCGLRQVILCVPRLPWATPLCGISLRAGLPIRPQGAPSDPRESKWNSVKGAAAPP